MNTPILLTQYLSDLLQNHLLFLTNNTFRVVVLVLQILKN